jgi:2,7-dihydroxy-5-methyl-1-naphthoate 7-O-methyltransferase
MDGAVASERAETGRAPADLWALSDLCTPWCVHVVATLRIAEHLEAGIGRIDDLAAAAGCDALALRGVLRHLVAKGLFSEPVADRFALEEAGRGLLDPAMRLGLDLEGIGGRMAHAWSTLPAYVRTGAAAYDEVFGAPFWDDLAAHPDVAASFDELMGPAGHGTPDPAFDLRDGWEQVREVVDVGGGTGAMLAEVLRARPGLRGTLVDLPGTVARARPVLEAAGVADRVTAVGQSFFDPLPAGADVYLVRKVINDWPDREARAILARCAEAAGQRGRVVVIGSVSADEDRGGVTIEMVLLAGRHRTLAEFRALAREAGLEVVASGRESSGRSVVECRRA